MQTLVPLRKARIKAGAYTELTASSQADALQKILRERRRELAFVSRWYDMKRLNANDDPADDITVTREFYPYTTSSVLDGEPAKTYTLEPGSRHYALPIPTVDIDRSKGELKQNTY